MSLSNLIAKLPAWTLAELHAARRNALAKLDDPKSGSNAAAMLDAIDQELERRSLPGMIKRFNEVYPGGFYGERQAEEERDYKVAASEECRRLFDREAFCELLERDEWAELVQRFKTVVSSTTLIQGAFEKPKLIDTVKNPANTAIYFRALYDSLWGEGELLERFDRYCKVLEDLGLAKWTYATYFAFLTDPERCMFVKPEMLKKSIELANHWLEYEPTPSARKYGEILEFSRWLQERIAVLKPRDMIDVHSFMWHMAPTGKWADE
jgi:hypothetical protein